MKYTHQTTVERKYLNTVTKRLKKPCFSDPVKSKILQGFLTNLGGERGAGSSSYPAGMSGSSFNPVETPPGIP